KAKSFRLGNIIEYDSRLFTIDVIAEEFPTLNTTDFGIGVVGWNNIKPVEITRERLIDLGFDGDSQDMWIVLPTGEGLELHFSCVMKEVWITKDGISDVLRCSHKYMYLKDIDYIHEMQNLFFVLSGTELETDVLLN